MKDLGGQLEKINGRANKMLGCIKRICQHFCMHFVFKNKNELLGF